MAKAKKTKAKKAAKRKEKEQVCEIFDITKDGKEKEVKACGEISNPKLSKKQLANQNKILKWFFMGIGIVVVFLLLIIYLINSAGTFNYRGVEGKVVQEGKLIFYEVEFPYLRDGKLISYFVYIRNDPRTLHYEVPFNGEMNFGDIFNVDGRYRLVINQTEDFSCEGHGAISIANMANLNALGILAIQDPNAGCDSGGRYMHLNIVSGDKTEINQLSETCYELTVNNCEILKGTERFMTEAFVYYYDHLQK